LPDPVLGVGRAVRGLRREALVVVVVADDDEVGPVLLERLPQRRDLRLVAVEAAAEQRMVPVGERTRLLVGGEVGAQPEILRQPTAMGRLLLSAIRCQEPRS
jgi:hypothetical protein